MLAFLFREVLEYKEVPEELKAKVAEMRLELIGALGEVGEGLPFCSFLFVVVNCTSALALALPGWLFALYRVRTCFFRTTCKTASSLTRSATFMAPRNYKEAIATAFPVPFSGF